MNNYKHINWWAEKWLRFIYNSVYDEGRLKRGANYFANGYIKKILLSHGCRVSATVEGSNSANYQVELKFGGLTDRQWDVFFDKISEHPIITEALFRGELHPKVKEIISDESLPLLSANLSNIKTSCSCLDNDSYWCKHRIAVMFALLDRINDDAFVLLGVNGRSQEQVQYELELRRQIHEVKDDFVGTEPTAEDLLSIAQGFWGEPKSYTPLPNIMLNKRNAPITVLNDDFELPFDLKSGLKITYPAVSKNLYEWLKQIESSNFFNSRFKFDDY